MILFILVFRIESNASSRLLHRMIPHPLRVMWHPSHNSTVPRLNLNVDILIGCVSTHSTSSRFRSFGLSRVPQLSQHFIV